MRPSLGLFIILTLSAIVLSASLPLFAALATTPERIFAGEGVLMISQASHEFLLTDDVVAGLAAQPWALAVSPEVYAFVVLERRPVVVRGVDAAPFLALEGLQVEPPSGPKFLMVGQRLSEDLGIEVGDRLLIPGSAQPLLMEVQVESILSSEGATADELVIDLPRARTLGGYGTRFIALVRVRVDSQQALLDHLEALRADVLVGNGRDTIRVEGGQVVDDRIGAIILTRPELGIELGRSYVSTFAQYSGNSLQLLVLGMHILTFSLFALMFAASLVRYTVEQRKDVGLILALGGRLRNLLATYSPRLLLVGVPAGLVGTLAGLSVGILLEDLGAFTLFGHVLHFDLSLSIYVTLLGTYLASLVLAVLLSLLFLSIQGPRDLLHEPPERSFSEVEWG